MGGCQNYGPFLGTLNIRCRIIMGTQKGTIILTTTHMNNSSSSGTNHEIKVEMIIIMTVDVVIVQKICCSCSSHSLAFAVWKLLKKGALRDPKDIWVMVLVRNYIW